MTLPAKLGIGLATLGSISVAGYAGSSYFSNSNNDSNKVVDEQPETIATSALIKEKFEYILLDSGTERTNADDTHWSNIWEAYKRDNASNDNDPLGLEGWNKSAPGDLTTVLKKKCSNLSKEQILRDNNTHYQKVTTYCARSVTIADQIKEDQLTPIDTSNADGIWKTRENDKANIQKHFSNLEITAKSNSDVKASDIKDGCEKAIKKDKKNGNFKTIYDAYKAVCVKKTGES